MLITLTEIKALVEFEKEFDELKFLDFGKPEVLHF